MTSNFFFGHKMLTEIVCVIQMSSYVGISVWRIVCVTTNYRFVNIMFSPPVVARVKRPCPSSAGQLHSLQQETLTDTDILF